eukprot:789182-Rhodomonas_salina.2
MHATNGASRISLRDRFYAVALCGADAAFGADVSMRWVLLAARDPPRPLRRQRRAPFAPTQVLRSLSLSLSPSLPLSPVSLLSLCLVLFLASLAALRSPLARANASSHSLARSR